MVEGKSLELLLEELGTNPKDTTQFEVLCDLYATAEPEQRERIRAFVALNRELRSAIEYWSPPGLEDNPVRHLELKLLAVSIRDGSPDRRDTLLQLAAEWYLAEEQGINPYPIFWAISNLSNDQDIHHAKGLIRQTCRASQRKKLYEDLQQFMK